MQANRRVYRPAAVGRLLLTDCCSAMRDLPLSKRPERAILDSQPPGIGGMSVQNDPFHAGRPPRRRQIRRTSVSVHWFPVHEAADPSWEEERLGSMRPVAFDALIVVYIQHTARHVHNPFTKTD